MSFCLLFVHHGAVGYLMLLVFLARSMFQDVAHVGEIEAFTTMLYCGEVQAGEDVIWRLGNVIVDSISLDLIMSHVQELWVHHLEVMGVVAHLTAQDRLSIRRHVWVVAVDDACDAVTATSLS